MAIPPVTPLPTAPSRSRPDTFATEADAFLGALDTFGTELNALGDAVEAAEIATAASETAAATSESNAASSETAAASSETAAASSETAAAASAAAAAASFDSFDDRYLGPKASDPATDNDGDPLSGGMIYYNTGSGTLKLYNGSAWVAAVLDANGALLAANNLSDLTDPAAAIANLGITADPTLGTLTKSFASGETASVSLSSSVSPTAVVAVTKEIGQVGVSSKGAWDVASDASNYELYNQAPATSLTLSANLSASSFVQSFSVSSQETGTTGVAFKSDGTKMYITGYIGDDVNEYDLSTAWDVSTAVYNQNFSVAAQELQPQDLTFKPDGTKMYVVGGSGSDVNEYDLSTAWDISTASFVQNVSVAANPRDVAFKPDGTKMYVIGATNDNIDEYNLSTAWDVSTASFVQSFSVTAQEDGPRGIFFSSDGTYFYITGEVGNEVNKFDLSTAWDISTSTFDSNFSVVTSAQGIYVQPAEDVFYIANYSTINEYNFGQTATLGTGSFSSSDVGKRIFVDDGGEAILTATDGSLSLTTAFGASSYTSGNWSLSGLDVDATDGITLSGSVGTSQPTAQYLPAITSSAGQIDSQYWTDINSMTADDADNDGEVYYAVSTDDRTTWSIAKASDGVRDIVRNNGGTWQYNSNATYGSTTWADATTNDEFASIAQAMTVSANQMNKTQLDAVTDGSHFTLSDTLDLAIVPYLASAGTAPTSDGVSINYDAAVLNKGAILGTDYDYDFPESDVVRITSLAAQNLKVRIV